MNWGKRIIVKYDKNLYNVTPALKTAFRLKEMNYGTYIYPIAVTYGADNKELYLEFEDFNNANEPLLLEYPNETALSGLDFPTEVFSIAPTLINLFKRGAYEYLGMTSIEATGVMLVLFDGKGYLPTEYIQLSSITATGTLFPLVFKEGYLPTEYIQLSSITATGVYCDVNGIPV